MRIIVNGVAYPQTAGATFTIKNLKLEKGTKPTKWTPAPEEEAAAQTQLIYISKASNTTSVTANTTWVTDANGGQNAWTTKRPVYNRDYPVLFVATQTRTIAQSQTGTACLCTTPVKDDTTTIIDGGHIITGTLTANQITTGVLKSFDETKTTYFDLTNSKLVAGNGGVVLDESGI